MREANAYAAVSHKREVHPMNYPSQEPQSRVKLLARKAKRALRQKNLDALENSLRPVNARSDRERIHVLGPYRNRDKWRVVLIDGKQVAASVNKANANSSNRGQ